MAQVSPRFCPRCGTPLVPGQTNCANCGLPLLRTSPQSSMPQPMRPMHPTQQVPLSSQQSQHITSSNIAPATQTPQTSQARGATQRRRLGRIGCIIIILLLLVFAGAGGYMVFSLLGDHVPGVTTGGNATQSPVTTTPVHETVIYAGVDVTVINAQHAQNFLDDPNSNADGMLRLNVQEHNPTTTTVRWLYYDIAQLVLPDGKTITPIYVKATVGIAPGATQNGSVDFAVPATDKIGQLILRLGATNEAQMDIPLTGNANLSKYAPTTVKPDGQLQYAGLNWTLVSATSQYSIAGQQASKGMRYIVVSLSVDNTLSQEAITGSPFSYIRLQSGNSTFSPADTTLPVSFDADLTGKSGTVTFLVPQKSTNFTLVLIPQNQNSTTQASTDFQLS